MSAENPLVDAVALTVSSAELGLVAQLITMRFSSPTAEAARLVRTRRLVHAAAELTHALSTYSRHALVHCQGTLGTSDLNADTSALDRALRTFSLEIHRVANAYPELHVETNSAQNRESVRAAPGATVRP